MILDKNLEKKKFQFFNKMDSKSNKLRLFLLRHGQRADYCPIEKKNIELSFDPHLTKLGGFQAEEAGSLIHSKVMGSIGKDQKSPKYLILSSPFLRTIMTSCSIIKSLGSENIYKNTIFLDNTICEHLAEKLGQDPLPNLHIRKTDISKLKKYFEYQLQDGLISEGEHVSIPKWPEEMVPRPHRLEGYGKLLKKVSEITQAESDLDLVVIIVTHWFTVEFMLEYHELPEMDPKKNPRLALDISLASISEVIASVDDEEKDEIVFFNYDKHLPLAKEKYETFLQTQ